MIVLIGFKILKIFDNVQQIFRADLRGFCFKILKIFDNVQLVPTEES